MNYIQEEVKTDVLVIGGGHAGTFAAMKARDEGLDVTLADKGTVGRAGKTPWSAAYSYADPSSGQLEDFYAESDRGSGSLVRKDYIDMWFNDSKSRYDDLSSWGALTAKNHGDAYREQLEKSNVRILNRTMIAELLMKDGRIAGAVGFSMEGDKAIIIHATAVVICSGSGAFKLPGYPNGCLTHDGQALAYRVGAEFAGKENVADRATVVKNLCNPWGQYGKEFEWTVLPRMSGSRASGPPEGGRGGDSPAAPGGGNERPVGERTEGRSVRASVSTQDMVDAAHAGKVPVTPQVLVGGPASMGPTMMEAEAELTLSGAIGMANHRFDGIFPKLNTCTTNVDGLFAGGDAVYAAISGTGVSSAGCTVLGARAGTEAAAYVQKTEKIQPSKADITEAADRVFLPRTREKGYSPAYVTQVLQHIMSPYYVLYLKKGERLKAALTNIGFLKDHFATSLKANDTHELRLAHETKNMLLNAEMMLRASLFRTESRGTHKREDFPDQDDKNWLAWIIISRDGDNMKLEKRPIPDEWKP